MNHYDGPAFYRKFAHDGAVNKGQKREALRKRKQHLSQNRGVSDFSKDVQRSDFSDFKPVKTPSQHIDLQNNPIARITAEFKPRLHYGESDQSVTRTSHEPSEFQQIHDHFNRLTNELTPSDDAVTLLASSGVNSTTATGRTGSVHFQLISSARSLTRDNDLRNETSIRKSSTTPVQRNYQAQPTESVQSDKSIVTENRSSNDSVSGDSDSSTFANDKVFDESNPSLKKSESVSVETDGSAPESSTTDSSSISLETDRETGRDRTDSLGSDVSDKGDRSVSEISEKSTEIDSKVGNSNSSAESNRPVSSGFSDKSEGSLHSQNSNSSDSDSSSAVLGKRPDFVAQNPTNVQPSSDFDDESDDSDEHHEIQPSVATDYQFPKPDMLVAPKRYEDQGLDDWILKKAETLNKTLRAFNVAAQVVDWTNGPTVTQFQVKLRLGVKVSKINHLSDDLKMALAAKDIRIQAPIPGKTTCGIEIPNPKPRPVMLSEVVNSKTFRNSKSDLTIALGVDLTGKPRVTDLRKMPHGLIAGATGSGKSVFINCMLVSLMYKATPQELKMILIDPKAVEFAPYNGIPYLLSPVISEPKQAAASLKWATKEMNQRYEKLAAAGVRNIEQFNRKAEDHNQPQMKMPYILIVIDELADLMMVAGDEIETYIVRITQKARAAGIHLVVATQRPSVDVITGTMKNNIPTRVAFMVSSQVDSRTIIDQSGAERLLGKGDMLYLGNGSSHPIRLQGCFVSNQEIDKVAGFARKQEPAHYAFHPGSLLKHVSRIENQDKLMPQVLAYIAKEKTVSTSKLQRVFSIGYNRAAKIIDDLERHGYISGQEGSKPRDIYLTEADYKKLNL